MATIARDPERRAIFFWRGIFARMIEEATVPIMTNDNEPNIIPSTLSRRIEGDGTFIEIEIYRIEGEEGWILEVVDEDDAATIYEDRFDTEQAALQEVLDAIAEHGVRVYLEEGFPDDEEEGDAFTLH